MKRRAPRRAAVALAVSLGLHLALLVFWVRFAPPAIQTPADHVSIEFEVHEAARPRPVVPPAPIVLPPPVARDKLARVRKASPSGPSTPPAAVTPPPAGSPAPSAPHLATPEELAAAQGEIAVPTVKVPDLGASATASAGKVVEAQIGLTLPMPQYEDRSIQAPEQDPDVNRRVATLINADQGRRRVERGMIDPYFAQLGKALLSSWELPASVEKPYANGVLSGLASNFMEGMAGWQQEAEQYGHTGSSAIGQRNPGERADDAAMDGVMPLAGPSTHKGAVIVRLTQSKAGRLLDVKLVIGSGNHEVDVAVVNGLRSGKTVLPVPPTEGMGIADPIHSLWAFELSIKVCPPAPVLNGGFDIAAPFDSKLGPAVDVCVPLDRTVKKHVELLEVN